MPCGYAVTIPDIPSSIILRSFTPILTLLAIVSCDSGRLDTSPGVSWDLAQHRAATISDIRYGLTLSIPEATDERITGVESITLNLADTTLPLVLDFRSQEQDVLAVHSLGRELPHEIVSGHIVIPGEALTLGTNVVELKFLAGDLSLNRNPEFLYTLFVPDRAATAFPSFDQPNLKAIFELTLETPATWKAVANSPLLRADTADGRITREFAPTRPISTYLFSFAAGEFRIETGERSGRVMHMYHRETDTAKVARNRDAVFDLHATALDWLEEYTGIPYPFDKFDFVLIPSFQYGGMEHPGAILYRASSVLLDESTTKNQELGRASLIAHETTHMWFGDLVTMAWFDDVWTKEVFANFMAAKIVNPSYPEINHDLRFLLSHYPAAYAIDRSDGANPIRQELDNLINAGTLYGAIIYQKAPIVMRHLERLIGEDTFRSGMQEYLTTFRYDNATWPDLIAILDQKTARDLQAWSRVWVQEPGRPTIHTELDIAADGIVRSLQLTQSDPADRGRTWIQQLDVALGWDDSISITSVDLADTTVDVPDADGLAAPRFVLAAGQGVGYGLFQLDTASTTYLLDHLTSIDDPLTRAASWVTLWDAVLEGTVTPQRFLDLILAALPAEDEELNVQRILGYLNETFWHYVSPVDRESIAPTVEKLLWTQLEQSPSTSLKAAYFNSYAAAALSGTGVNKLLEIWRKDMEIAGLQLSERDYTSLAQELALREIPEASEVLSQQHDRIENPDRRARFEFVLPALSADPAVRDSFFQSLKAPSNREHEPWVLEGVSFLHHPLRADQAVGYIMPSLELLEEIQLTGDIFFPKRWLDATLGGHSRPEAADIVRQFLESSSDYYPTRLRMKILQAADPLLRAARIVY
jgi:aminopeptidase N